MFCEHNWKKSIPVIFTGQLKQLFALLILIYLPEQCAYLLNVFIVLQVQFG